MTNDRFKFRMWIPNSDFGCVMVYRDIYDLNWYLHPTECKLYRKITQSDSSFNLMQCTGIKDKNGKIIFEGDILQHCELNEISVVTFGRGMFLINDSPLYYQYPNEFLEIVGNIHENTELLKEAE